ncbi:Ig-like domain repeat protein [Streptacidiphilus sp. P02-A3a]|uniref:Ig-like domain repeat protein n=1 Tax=Streptacidiphilus sp. P02-A3a TaxID=2704468 RepID=UPI0015FA06C0|nr:Ig-like domain repeat protein [Streptacidiphilus sp. P02-A3a]QMU67544.1 Ig-like domain repeat protein [Streptacidiphilus sp. P02-A3a]
MRVRRTALGAAGTVVAGMLAVIGLPAAPALATSAPATTAPATTAVALPITHYAQTVVAGGHVFISEGAGSSSILVTDLAGNTVTTIPGQTGATGLALSADGGTLYAALTGADSISAINVGTLTQSAVYPTGTGTAPVYLAVAGGRIWFGYGPANSWQGSIGSLDLSGPAPVVTLKQTAAQGLWFGPPMLAADPADPDLVIAGDTGQEPPDLNAYNVSTGTPVETAGLAPGSNYGALADMAVTADGKDLVLATGAPYDQVLLKTSTLAPDGDYPTAAYPDAVAVAPSGTVAAGVSQDDPDLYVYAPGGSAPLGSYGLGNSVAPRGLAWSPDSGTLFAVTDTGPGSTSYTLNIQQSPALATSRLTLSAPGTAIPGRQLTVQGTLSSATPFPAGTTVTVTRTDPADPNGVALPSATVGADGTFSTTDTPTAPGSYSYTASYAGDAAHAGASAGASVQVAYPAAVPVLTAPATDTRGKALRITGQLPDGPYPAGAAVQIVRTDPAHPAGVALPQAAVAADGSFAFTDTPRTGGANTYQVSYAGDATHTAGAADATVQVSRAATTIGVSLDTADRTYAYNAAVGVTVHLGADHGSTVAVYAQPYGGARALVASGAVDARGDFTGWYRITRNTTFSASFAGDADDAPATSGTVVGWSHADVVDTLSGYYTTVRQGGAQWRVYHQSAQPVFAVGVAPDKAGECAASTLQEYVGSAWRTVATDACATLGSTSTTAVGATLTNAVGHRFRAIAEYVPGATDTQNLSTYGSWQYFLVRA